MVAINPQTISKVTNFAKTAFNKLAENPAEGSLFDAFNKLGIKNTDDLKAGIELFKENPKDALKTAASTLKEKNFNIMGSIPNNTENSNNNNQVVNTGNENIDKILNKGLLSFASEKMDINNKDDLKEAYAKFKENPNDFSKDAIQKMGGSAEFAEKVGKFATKFLA